jgi:hypothetical protein
MRRSTSKRARQLRAYTAARQTWLEAHPQCAGKGVLDGVLAAEGLHCGGWADTVQHSAGRRGALLLDQRFWIPLCWNPCHMWVESHPLTATRLGFRVSRVSDE